METAQPEPVYGQQSILALPTAGGLSIDGADAVYVTNQTLKGVLKLSAGSGIPTELPMEGVTNPAALTVDFAGTVYVVDIGNGVWDYNGLRDTQVLALAVGSSSPAQLCDCLEDPQGVAVDANGNVYVTDGFNGNLLKVSGPGRDREVLWGLEYACGVAVDSSDSIYVTDLDAGRVLKLTQESMARRWKYDPRPPHITELPFGDLEGPHGVAVDREGSVYITDYSNRVLKLAAGATTPTELPFTGLDEPTDIAVDSGGSVYVLTVDGRVSTLSPIRGRL